MYFKDDTSDDASELSEEPQPLKAKIYYPYISFGSLSHATGHFKKLYCKETCNNMCLFCNST